MQFLADVELICEECRGTRFQSSVLDVRFRDKNIHEVLALTVREALQFFAGVPKVLSNSEFSKKWASTICVWANLRPLFRAAKRNV